MPIYEYQCEKCGKKFETIQKMSDKPLKKHEKCGGALTKLISASGFQFKGTGWYVTDYARKGSGESKETSTDKMVNLITPALFKRCRTAKDFAEIDTAELEKLIHSSGFFRNKAKNIKAASRIITDEYKGQVPSTMEELLKLSGVARKTANVVLGVAFVTADGVVVDTHVQRLSRRLDFTKEERPDKIERDLMQLFPREKW